MNACLCTVVHQLAESFDEAQAKAIWPALNQHLRDVRAVLAQSRYLAQEAHYAVTPNNARTAKVLAVESIDLAPIARLRDRLAQDPNAFWGEASADDAVHNALQRRLACVVLFLRSRIDAEAPVPPRIKALFPGQQNYLELRTCGRKYLKMSRRLSQLGSVLWLPLEVPHST